jgi:hypothetical protein
MGLRCFIPLWLGLILLLGACNKKVAPVIPQPQPVSKPEPPPVLRLPVPKAWPDLPLQPAKIPAPPEPVIAASFHDAEINFEGGKYKEAIPAYDRYIREDPTTLYKAEAMFKLGMSYALSCSTPECRTAPVTQFKRLIAAFPKSTFSAQAQLILGLLNEIERLKGDVKARDEKLTKLTDELERLKKIDLERQPARIKK